MQQFAHLLEERIGPDAGTWRINTVIESDSEKKSEHFWSYVVAKSGTQRLDQNEDHETDSAYYENIEKMSDGIET